MTTLNTQMSDWASTDPRSVNAMLRGKGDLRGQLYEKSVATLRLINPKITDEQIASGYRIWLDNIDWVFPESVFGQRGLMFGNWLIDVGFRIVRWLGFEDKL